eukprot:766212-Hanusia_phi.AAC.4
MPNNTPIRQKKMVCIACVSSLSNGINTLFSQQPKRLPPFLQGVGAVDPRRGGGEGLFGVAVDVTAVPGPLAHQAHLQDPLLAGGQPGIPPAHLGSGLVDVHHIAQGELAGGAVLDELLGDGPLHLVPLDLHHAVEAAVAVLEG